MLKEKTARFIFTSLKKEHPSLPESLQVKLEYARDEKFGDYACLIAMDKSWRDFLSSEDPALANPRKSAEHILKVIQKQSDFSRWFRNAEIAGPGFINLTVSERAFFNIISSSENGLPYGHTKRDNPENIVFEFVSANPTGPLNVVSARAAALGDSVCNLLMAAGHRVHREYYVNDYGNQVRLLGFSCLYRYLESEGISLRFSVKNEDGSVSYPAGPGIPFPSEGYHGEYLRDVAAAVIKKDPSVKLPESMLSNLKRLTGSPAALSNTVKAPSAPPVAPVSGNPELRSGLPSAGSLTDTALTVYLETELSETAEKFGKEATAWFLETQKKDLERFRVKFDNFYSERSLHESGAVMKAAEAVNKYTFSESGKTVFRSTDFGDDKDRVIIRDDGRPTYLLADIAYHKTKMDRGYSKIINIWGPDHHGYIKRLEGAMAAMGYQPENFRVLIAQQVNLLDAGKPVVMSKRTGRFITMDTLIDEIPVDVTRYFFVMRSFESHLDFDMTEAKDTSEKNPYYYVAYAHARIRSIFTKAAERGLYPLGSDPDSEEFAKSVSSFDFTPERRRLLWLAARFPEEIRDAADSLEPHRVITYLYNLASALSRFYAPKENRIIDQDPVTASVLLTILDSVAVCLKTGLGLLGMEAPDRMVREDEDAEESSPENS